MIMMPPQKRQVPNIPPAVAEKLQARMPEFKAGGGGGLAGNVMRGGGSSAGGGLSPVQEAIARRLRQGKRLK